MLGLAKKIFGSQNDRDIKRYQAIVNQINPHEESLARLSDADLKAKTAYFKQKLDQGATLSDLLVETFAVVREVAKRVLNMRHFDMQLLGGMVLNDGRIAEMKTGEGKTLVATLPVYLNALAGQGVHIVTVNDYLASRDAEWMGKVYKFLGLSVGTILHGLSDKERQAAYRSDITYGTNNEYGFDYLRDNMKFSVASMVQRKLNFAIVDEVDSILIDEARTPLIISGPSEKSTSQYIEINRVIPGLQKDKHFKIDEKSRSVTLTEEGVTEMERRLGIENLYDATHIETLHHVHQGLKAHYIFKLDVDYVVKDGIQIVDEFTGRLMPGRRWSDGLHQAIEAKEGVPIETENQTLASITFQNYFRLYKKLSGMTGTADTEAPEFAKIYNLDVVVIPTNKPLIRSDLNDLIYRNERAKFRAVVEDVKEERAKGRPILIGTIAIEKSEVLSKLLTQAGVPHNVLNAKHHQREAEIVAQAGRKGNVTVSTNMAGRGTDIVLGGNPEFLAKAKADPEAEPEKFASELEKAFEQCKKEQQEVLQAGGLYVLGTERHESRRIDNQLRGRSGRQGDPGQTRFYISLEDDLMRIFGSERIAKVMDTLGMGEEDVIQHRFISKAIENAQKKVEAHNFEIRKNVLEYDDVLNQQRKTIYELRRVILSENVLDDQLTDMIDAVVTNLISVYGPDRKGNLERAKIDEQFFNHFGFHFESPSVKSSADDLGAKMYDDVITFFQNKKQKYGDELMEQAMRFFMLQTLDDLWKDHLLTMDHLREGIGLRGYAQKDPKMEYKKEGFALFEDMMSRFYALTVERIFKVQIQTEEEVKLREEDNKDLILSRGQGSRERKQLPVKREAPKVGRNDPCPCGSGKKYKKCHGEENAA